MLTTREKKIYPLADNITTLPISILANPATANIFET